MNNTRLRLLTAISITLLSYGCSQHIPPSPPQAVLPMNNNVFSIVNEEVSDTPIKTQITQHLVVASIPTRDQLNAELLARYQTALARRGFRYHEAPTNIFIYIYGSKEQAQAEQGLWIAMIEKGAYDTSPRPMIDEGRLSALLSQPDKRFGLSEERRRVAFKAIAAAEACATKDATSQVPSSQIMKQITRERELKTRYRRAVARDHGLTEKQMQSLVIEGVTKGWPR